MQTQRTILRHRCGFVSLLDEEIFGIVHGYWLGALHFCKRSLVSSLGIPFADHVDMPRSLVRVPESGQNGQAPENLHAYFRQSSATMVSNADLRMWGCL
jgi:hypothetical protein